MIIKMEQPTNKNNDSEVIIDKFESNLTDNKSEFNTKENNRIFNYDKQNIKPLDTNFVKNKELKISPRIYSRLLRSQGHLCIAKEATDEMHSYLKTYIDRVITTCVDLLIKNNITNTFGKIDVFKTHKKTDKTKDVYENLQKYMFINEYDNFQKSTKKGDKEKDKDIIARTKHMSKCCMYNAFLLNNMVLNSISDPKPTWVIIYGKNMLNTCFSQTPLYKSFYKNVKTENGQMLDNSIDENTKNKLDQIKKNFENFNHSAEVDFKKILDTIKTGNLDEIYDLAINVPKYNKDFELAIINGKDMLNVCFSETPLYKKTFKNAVKITNNNNEEVKTIIEPEVYENLNKIYKNFDNVDYSKINIKDCFKTIRSATKLHDVYELSTTIPKNNTDNIGFDTNIRKYVKRWLNVVKESKNTEELYIDDIYKYISDVKYKDEFAESFDDDKDIEKQLSDIEGIDKQLTNCEKLRRLVLMNLNFNDIKINKFDLTKLELEKLNLSEVDPNESKLEKNDLDKFEVSDLNKIKIRKQKKLGKYLSLLDNNVKLDRNYYMKFSNDLFIPKATFQNYVKHLIRGRDVDSKKDADQGTGINLSSDLLFSMQVAFEELFKRVAYKTYHNAVKVSNRSTVFDTDINAYFGVLENEPVHEFLKKLAYM